MQQVSEHVWAEVDYDGSNVGMIVGERGIVLVEAPMCPTDAKDWLSKVKGVSDKPVLFVVTTDHHFDHAVCSSMLCRNIIMHEAAAVAFGREVKGRVVELFETYFSERLEEVREDVEKLETLDPLITFETSMTIDLGGVQAELIHTGGHASGTSLIHVIPDRVLFAGDNVTNGRHAYMGEMSLAKWLDALDRTAGLAPKVVVPGHGDVGDIESVHTMNRFFTRMKEIVASGIASGEDEDTVATRGADLLAFFRMQPGREEMTPQWIEEGLRLSYREMR